jgi:hypothetical protein
MGLFYKTPPELESTFRAVMGLAGEIAIRGKGHGTPGYLEQELLPRAIAETQAARTRLLAAGRAQDLKRFRKHLLSVGGFMDNGPYNRMFLPFVNEHLHD